jgi:hypothetical protein
MSISEAGATAGRYPLSANLGLLCIFDKGATDGAFGPRHLVIHGWRVRGELDLAALRGALDDVVERHEILRTEIVRDGGEQYQRVHPPSSPELRVHELTDNGLPRDEQVDDFVNSVEAGRLGADVLPHLRAELGRFDDQDAVLVLIVHHTAGDGWSLHVLIHELAVSYARRRGLDVPELPEARQYGDFSVRQIDDLATANSQASRDYWGGKLRGGRMLDIKSDRTLAPETAAVYAVERFLLDAELTRGTMELARVMHSSPFMVLLAAFNALLARKSGATDLVVPIITSGRSDSAFMETVGPFFNLVPLRTDIDGCRTFSELVLRIRATCLEAYAHELPFSEVVAQAPEINKTYERDDNAVCAIQVLQFPGMTEAETVGDVEYAEVRKRTKSCDDTSDIPNGVLWALDILADGEIAGTSRYNTEQFDRETMVRMIEDYRGILASGLTDPNRPLWAL